MLHGGGTGILIRVSGLLPGLQQRKTKSKTNNKSHFAGLAPPSRYFTFASPKESTQRKGDPQCRETPPQPSRPGRGRNLRRASVAPLRTADRLIPWTARLCRLALTGPITLDGCFNQKKSSIKTTVPMQPLGPIKHADGWPGRGLKRLQCLSDLTLANREFRRASHRAGPVGQPQAMLVGWPWR